MNPLNSSQLIPYPIINFARDIKKFFWQHYKRINDTKLRRHLFYRIFIILFHFSKKSEIGCDNSIFTYKSEI